MMVRAKDRHMLKKNSARPVVALKIRFDRVREFKLTTALAKPLAGHRSLKTKLSVRLLVRVVIWSPLRIVHSSAAAAADQYFGRQNFDERTLAHAEFGNGMDDDRRFLSERAKGCLARSTCCRRGFDRACAGVIGWLLSLRGIATCDEI